MSQSVTIMLQHYLRGPKNREVPFGKPGFAGYCVYVFKPKYPERDRMALDNPHLCEVSDKEHINRLLSITEGYQLYLGEDDAPLPELVDEQEELEQPFGDLAELDVFAMTDDDLRKFAKAIMDVVPNRKEPILTWYAETFDDRDPLDAASNIVDLLRQCAAAIVEKEQQMKSGEI